MSSVNMEFEEQDEELERPSYHDSPGHNNSNSARSKLTKYKECLKNHAVAIGGHAVDGCGEFIPSGDDSLKCAACNCHRSFHRKEQFGGSTTGFAFQHFTAYHHHHHRGGGPPSGYLHVGQPQQRPTPLLALPSNSGGGGSELEDYYGSLGGRKRFRTKFTAEQKEKMVKLAGRVGWRIQKQDEEMVEEFCREMGIKRQVLKVWMHNNKHTIGKKTLEINSNNNNNNNNNDDASFPN